MPCAVSFFRLPWCLPRREPHNGSAVLQHKDTYMCLPDWVQQHSPYTGCAQSDAWFALSNPLTPPTCMHGYASPVQSAYLDMGVQTVRHVPRVFTQQAAIPVQTRRASKNPLVPLAKTVRGTFVSLNRRSKGDRQLTADGHTAWACQ